MKNVNPWFSFVGLLLLLIGLFASLRTIYNLTQSRYPQGGVLAVNTSGYPPALQRESDCVYTQQYFSEDGITPRQPTDSEKRQTEIDEKRCMTGIGQTRADVRAQDIGVSALFLFLGGGLLLSRRLLASK